MDLNGDSYVDKYEMYVYFQKLLGNKNQTTTWEDFEQNILNNLMPIYSQRL